MADIFDISISALQAFQSALNVTGNNIANANTAGYNRQSVDLATRVPQYTGSGWIGSGVNMVAVTRAFDQASANQLNHSQSMLGQLNALKTYSDQFDNLFSSTSGSISSAVSGFFSAASDLANDPTSTSARTAFIGDAQTLASSLQNASQQLDTAESDINTRLSADVAQVNTYAQSIARLNTQIANAGAGGQGQQPNDLLDQRDQLVTQLSKLVGVTTTTDTNGALNVFVGNGQALVVQGNVYGLKTLANEFNPSRLEIGISTAGNNAISTSIGSGEIGGLLAARTQVIDPVRNQLGQLTTAIVQSVNQQQAVGVDLNGALGKALFSSIGPQTEGSSRNTGGASVTATVSDLGALAADSYQLSYNGGAYTLTRESDGSVVSTTGAGTTASPLQAEGLSLVIAGTPANGDKFRIDPTGSAAGSIAVVLTNTAQIAAAGAVRTSAAGANTGSGAISAGSVVDAADPNLFTTATIAFTSATTYSINGAGSFTYTPGAAIAQNGWKVQISGTPATGDTFTVQRNTGGGGDNRNALALAALQNQSVLNGGTVSIGGALSSLVTSVGTKAQQVSQAQSAQTAVNTSAQQVVQSKSGVNLDEEAAALLQWQQAYQAAAQALKVGSSLFDTLIAAVRAG
ncbi:MAG: flagellar hook-associated protein FlgK [Proteobacteria bacterium]|nr:flagellar hook-associated protein FlgK [Pseudomonadota bacterium]